MPIYTFSNLNSRINAGIKGKIGILTNNRDTMNQVAREVLADIDLRSTKRKVPLTPNMFSQPFAYPAPADMKGIKIISIQDQSGKKQTDFRLVGFQNFNTRQDLNTIAFDNSDFLNKMLVNTFVNDNTLTISNLDSLTAGGGTWVVSSTGATNLVADSDQYIRESASLKFDLSALAVTTAGIKNTTLNSFDMTAYLQGSGVALVYVYITSATNLTNFILKIGTNDSNYYTKTTTSAYDSTAFRQGWNLLQFDLSALTTTGTPTNATNRYVELYMTKTTGKVSELGYRFDSLVLKRGVVSNVNYYSKYPWQTIAGVYIENSTTDSDLLNVDTDEFDLMVQKGVEVAGPEVDEFDAADRAAKKYSAMKREYQLNNPSEAQLMVDTYATFIRQ